MKFVRKLCLAAVAGGLTVTLAGSASPAAAYDTGWGCGGWCRTTGEHP